MGHQVSKSAGKSAEKITNTDGFVNLAGSFSTGREVKSNGDAT